MRICTTLPGIIVAVGLAYTQADIPEVMKEADELFWLDNWVAARPLFLTAEETARRTGNMRDALYARVSRLRADAERESYSQVLESLRADERNPLLAADPMIRLRYYVV